MIVVLVGIRGLGTWWEGVCADRVKGKVASNREVEYERELLLLSVFCMLGFGLLALKVFQG